MKENVKFFEKKEKEMEIIKKLKKEKLQKFK